MRSCKEDALTSPYDVITFLSHFSLSLLSHLPLSLSSLSHLSPPPSLSPLQLPSEVPPSSAARHSPRAQPHRVRADHLLHSLSSQWLLRWLWHCQGLRRRSSLLQALPQRSGACEKDRSQRLTALSSSSFKTLNKVMYRHNYTMYVTVCNTTILLHRVPVHVLLPHQCFFCAIIFILLCVLYVIIYHYECLQVLIHLFFFFWSQFCRILYEWRHDACGLTQATLLKPTSWWYYFGHFCRD